MSSNAETKLLRELEPRGFLLLASWPWAIIACDRGDTLEVWRTTGSRYRFFSALSRVKATARSDTIQAIAHVALLFAQSLAELRVHTSHVGILDRRHVRPGLDHFRLEPVCGKNSAHYTMEDDLAHREFQKIISEHASSGSPEI